MIKRTLQAMLALLCVHTTDAATIGGTNSANVIIPDAGPFVSSPIAISGAPAGAIVTNIDLYFRCIHPYSADVVVELWADADGALGARTLWNREGGSANNPMRTVTGISTFNGLPVNRIWRLAARDNVLADSGYIDEWTMTIHYTAPEAPGAFSLSLDSVVCDRTNAPVPAVKLNWTGSQGALVSYQVFRNGNPIGSPTQGLTFYDSSGLTAGQPYFYHVQASNPGGSTNSATLDVSIPVDVCGTPPGNFSLSGDAPVCDGSGPVAVPAILVHWTAAAGAGVSYQVFRNSNPISPATNGLAFYDNIGLTAGQTYSYIVRATNAGGATFSSSVIVPIAVDICWPPTNTTRALGINVAAADGDIDWSRVRAAGRSFALIKATDGRRSQTGDMTVDGRFVANMTAATHAELLVAPYHFARPHTNSPLDEASHFLAAAGSYIVSGYLPPALAITDPDDEAPSAVSGMGKAALSQWIRDWCSEIVRATGVKPVLYLPVAFAQDYLEADLAQYPLWIANYTIPPAPPMSPNANPSALGPWDTTWSFMQYSIVGTTIDGVPNSPVQLDVFNGEITELQRFVIPFITISGVDGGPFQPPNGGQFQLQVNASTLQQATVQVSQDGVDWFDLGPVSIVNGRGLFTDPNAGSHSMRFYRVTP